MAVLAPKKALEVNGQEIYPLTHAKQVIMDDGNRLNDKITEIEASGHGTHVGPNPPEDTLKLWIDTDDDTEDEMPGGNVDLTGYATEQYVKSYAQPKGNYLTEVPDKYALKSDIPTQVTQLENNAGYLTEHQDLSEYAKKTELPTIPTKVSAFENDKGYLTEHQSLAGYAKTSDIPTKPEDIGAQPSGNYALKSEIPSVPVQSVNGKTGAVSLSASDVGARPSTWMPSASDVGALPSTTKIPAKTSELTNDSGFIIGYTETDPTVPAWAKNATKPSYTASEVGALPSTTKIPSKTSDLTNDSGFITGYTETDPTVPSWAKASSKPTYSKSEVGLGNVDNVKQYSASNPPPYPVTSVNGKTGAVTVDVPSVPSWAMETSKPSYSKSEVGLGNVDNVKQYSASNPPPYPVTSVNGKTGAVTVDIPTVPTKVSAFTNDAGYLTQHQDISGLAEKFDPTVYGLPILDLTGDTSRMTKDVEVTLSYKCNDKNGTAKTGSCTMKWQGSSSLAYDKKNYTIKFDNAFEVVDGWGSQKKYCLKANFIDHSHTRNIVCAKLWGQIVKSRATANAKLNALPNGGAVDGFPIILVLNGEFHGLYTWNIPKDGWMFGMGSGTKEAVVGADNQAEDTAFKTETLLDAEGLELEYSSSAFTATQVKDSLNQLINACIDSWGGDLDTTVAKYLDWESAIDYFLFVVLLDGGDMTTKNYLLSTFDGIKWHFSAYDMDSVMGLRWDGKYFFGAHEGEKFESYKDAHRIMELIYRFKTNALKARWKELRGYHLTESRICRMFENFACAIPSPVYLEDVKRWTTIPSSSVNNVDQILRWVRQRLAFVDGWVESLPAQETPAAPVTMKNWVEYAEDTAAGSLYNGCGYKDNTRLSSSGSVSSSAQNGSVTVGFIPFVATDVIRIKGAIFKGLKADTDGHYYLHFYKSDKTLLEGASVQEFEDSYASQMSITYDVTTGITTIDVVEGSAFASRLANAAYFRINVKGKGPDLIITRNQEIK